MGYRTGRPCADGLRLIDIRKVLTRSDQTALKAFGSKKGIAESVDELKQRNRVES